MTVTISIPPTTEAKLLDQASSKGRDVSSLVLEAIEARFGIAPQARKVEVEDAAVAFDKLLDDFFAENPEHLPSLPADFSREDSSPS